MTMTTLTRHARPFGYRKVFPFELVCLLPDNNLRQDFRLYKNDGIPFMAETGDNTAYQQIPTNVMGQLHGTGYVVEDGEITGMVVYENNICVMSRLLLGKGVYLETWFNEFGDMIAQQEVAADAIKTHLAA